MSELITVKEAFIRYCEELEFQKRIANTYEWHLKNVRISGKVSFADVSDKREVLILQALKIRGKWFLNKAAFEKGLSKIKLNVRDHVPNIHKWWKG